MSTDFFTSQDDARRQTGRLVALFTLGVMGTMLSLWLVAVVALAIGGSGRNGSGPDWAGAFSNWQALLAVIVSVGGVVGIVTLFKLGQMSQSGAAIAEILGGTRIAPSTRDPGERQLLNIVEEMSIASGVPVPPVYVLEDASINAFAAGPDPSNSAIGVTRGCMELLSRDEMQGVIAHEYSHIFHGDTRINARTTAVIAGIMAVGLIGYLCFRFVGPALARSRGGKNNPGPAIGAALIVIGLAVWAIGSIGMLFGRLIQAAISRQREFLADAAAVQYTRNPNGIACALAKIRDHSARVSSPKASELNHFFFASTLHTLFATHPPIERRIAALKAMGALGVPERARSASADEANRKFGQRSATARAANAGAAGIAGVAGVANVAGLGGEGPGGKSLGGAVPGGAAAAPSAGIDAEIARAGTLDEAGIGAVAAWRASLPAEIVDATRDPIGARALCYAIARRADGHARCDEVVASGDREAYDAYARLATPLARISGDAQLALVDLAASALLDLGAERYRRFRETLARAMRSDGVIDLREWALVKCLERHVERRLAQMPTKASLRLAQLPGEVRTLIATVASAEHAGDEARAAFNRAYSGMGMQAPAMPGPAERSLDALNAAVSRLAQLTFTDRAKLLALAARAAAHDDRVSETEHLVLRAVADALDVPLPALARVGS
jgi:Zn-dependent protease with chaperone function